MRSIFIYNRFLFTSFWQKVKGVNKQLNEITLLEAEFVQIKIKKNSNDEGQ